MGNTLAKGDTTGHANNVAENGGLKSRPVSLVGTAQLGPRSTMRASMRGEKPQDKQPMPLDTAEIERRFTKVLVSERVVHAHLIYKMIFDDDMEPVYVLATHGHIIIARFFKFLKLIVCLDTTTFL